MSVSSCCLYLFFFIRWGVLVLELKVVRKPARETTSIEENDDAKRSTYRDKLLLISTIQHSARRPGGKKK